MSTATRRDELAEAVRSALISPNVADSNLEAANVVDVLDEIGSAIRQGRSISAAGERIGSGLDAVAAAIGDLAEAIREGRTP
jgi:hypothetical protein